MEFGGKRGNNMNGATLVQAGDVCGLEPGDSRKLCLGKDSDGARQEIFVPVYMCVHVHVRNIKK